MQCASALQSMQEITVILKRRERDEREKSIDSNIEEIGIQNTPRIVVSYPIALVITPSLFFTIARASNLYYIS